MKTETYDACVGMVGSVASKYARTFWRPAKIEAGDIAGELWLWIAKHPEKVEGWLAEENGHRPILTTLGHEALRYCQKEKAARLGYKVDDLSYWSTGEVKALLGSMYDPDAWLSAPQSEGRSTKAAHEGGNWIATLADLARAVANLSPEQRELLEHVHRDDLPVAETAERLEKTGSAVYHSLDAIYKKLVVGLGGHRPDDTHDPDCECGQIVGNRRAVSNATARHITDADYGGDPDDYAGTPKKPGRGFMS